MTPFQDICWYSGWIMAGRDRRVRHLPKRVLRQYGYVQTIPRSPTDIGPLAPEEVAMAFMEFALHVLSQQEKGDLVPDDEPLSHSRGYMCWFYRVSHPIVNPPAVVPHYTTDAHLRPIPPYKEVIVEQQWARHHPDPYQIISNISPEWTVQWGILMCLVIQRFFAWCRASSPSGVWWSRCRLRGGGVGVHGSRVLTLWLLYFCSFFMTFGRIWM